MGYDQGCQICAEGAAVLKDIVFLTVLYPKSLAGRGRGSGRRRGRGRGELAAANSRQKVGKKTGWGNENFSLEHRTEYVISHTFHLPTLIPRRPPTVCVILPQT